MARLWLKKKAVPTCDKPGLTGRRFRPQDSRMRFLLERVFRKKIERGELKHLTYPQEEKSTEISLVGATESEEEQTELFFDEEKRMWSLDLGLL